MRTIALVALGLLPTIAFAESSEDYAIMAKSSWSEFVCAVLASDAGLTNDHERLFKLGFDHGKSVLEALRLSTIQMDDLEGVPWGFTLHLDGPSADFSLGMIWSAAVSVGALGVKHDLDGNLFDRSQWASNAKNRYDKDSCNLL